MFQERLRRQVDGFGNRFVRDTPVPYLDDGLPVEATRNLVEDIGDEDPVCHETLADRGTPWNPRR